jgi:hypothetical protein
MRRLVVVLALALVLVPLAAATALAVGAKIQCPRTLPCVASGDKDLVLERQGSVLDDIRLRGGDDHVWAQRYSNDLDKVLGGPGRDDINVADEDMRDTADGGPGRDHCIVDASREAQSCEQVLVVGPERP